MNTTTTTDQATTKRSKGFVIGSSVAGIAVLAGATTAMILAFSSPASAHHTPAPAPAHHAVAPAVPVTPANGPSTPSNVPNTPANRPVVPVNPNPELPAAQIKTIQQELGDLNYYEGPINGVMTPQTVQAIKYLQRDAQLPQNGYYDQVTYLALQHFLAAGNNQMAG